MLFYKHECTLIYENQNMWCYSVMERVANKKRDLSASGLAMEYSKRVVEI